MTSQIQLIMTSNSRPLASDKYKALVVATLDYLIEHYTGEFVCDGFDPIKDYYQRQQIQAGKYGKQGNVKRLQQQLDKFTDRLLQNTDLAFTEYIKERTGYELDIFKDLLALGEEVLSSGEIRDEAESRKVMALIELNKKTEIEGEKAEQLISILNNFSRLMSLRDQQNPQISKVSRTEEIDGEMVEFVEISYGPRPKHNKNREVVSPDKKRRIYISEWMHPNGDQANTSVNISFKTSSGGIYVVEGICPELNAFWKDNNTVVIETNKAYKILLQYYLMQSFDDEVRVEYVERN